ncbi:uncharacterized protein LOC106769995 isoform X5 [Vigna radiata var. radiata]|uniref:Uncharacterized protein LOC106769995 isoform X5 n=1 Tax=Vigna radiata var. radiata TaxID=3916 RepID=A0A3Q0FEB3_VIGRR|nr:uncharacterized protein LOC106769995 isoform X5 [Vigna radiata var. radiata]
MLTWECYSFNRGDAGFSSQICISISIRNNHFIHTSQPYNTNQKQSSTRPRLDGKAKTAKLVRKTEHKLFLFPDIKFHTDIFVSVPKADTIFMKGRENNKEERSFRESFGVHPFERLRKQDKHEA